MSTSADVSAARRKPGPGLQAQEAPDLRQPRRGRVVVIAVVVWAVTQGSSSAPMPSFTIAYGQGTVANSDSIIDSEPAARQDDPRPAAFRAVRRGRHRHRRDAQRQPAGHQRGRQPAGRRRHRHRHRRSTVVIAQSFDADALIVPESIHHGRPAGRQVRRRPGRLLRGLRAAGLARAGAPDVLGQGRRLRQRAGGGRRLPGRLGDRRVRAGRAGGPARSAKGGHPLINAEQIAKLGIPGLNVVAVADSVVKNDPALVQKYVCAEVQATRLFTGPAGGQVPDPERQGPGRPRPTSSSPATKDFPFIPLSQQLHWLGSRRTTPAARSSRPTSRPGSSWSGRAG